MYTTPRQSASRLRPARKDIPEGPIRDFISVIDNTISEDWQQRTSAFETLVATIPSGTEYSRGESWFNSPPILRHLAWPLTELIKDARSTVVKRTCESCTELFSKCQIDARYLLKDIMPTILGVHAQTVQVIRSYVETMVIEALTVVPCKMAMPIWLDRLKSDKSRTVREACSLYLGVGLAEWGQMDRYLTIEIWNQVGAALVKVLRDASPAVRTNAKKALETVHREKPDVFDRLVTDSELTRDIRVKKLLRRIGAGETIGDDVSVASSRMGSVVSRQSHLGGGSVSGRSAGNYRTRTRGGGAGTGGSVTRGMSSTRSTGGGRSVGIPRTIGVATPPSTTATNSTGGSGHSRSGRYGGTTGSSLGPPVRVTTTSASRGLGRTKYGSDPPANATRRTDNRTTMTSTSSSPPGRTNGHTNGGIPHAPQDGSSTPTSLRGRNSSDSAAERRRSTSFDTADDSVASELINVIASTNELRQVAKLKRSNSRRSSLLQERFARIGISNENINQDNTNNVQPEKDDDLLDDILDDVIDSPKKNYKTTNGGGGGRGGTAAMMMTTTATTTDSAIPEHVKIAQELLDAHKRHVDQIMETLKIEMDTLKDFELTLMGTGGSGSGPTEDEVLEYFESVGLCLEQRTKASSILQKKLDRISKGK